MIVVMKLICLKCQTCGSNLKRNFSMKSLDCEYCGSTYLVEFEGQTNSLEPDSFTLPVNITEEDAKKQLMKAINGKKFIHDQAESIISKLQPRGVMFPVYCFECAVTANWMGKNSVSKSRQVWNKSTEKYENESYSEWIPQNGQYFGNHTAFLAESNALKNSEISAFMPPPVNKKNPLLSSDDLDQRFALEIPGMTSDKAWEDEGEGQIKRKIKEACNKLVEQLDNVNSRIESKKTSIIYCPVWVFKYKVDDIPYRNIVCAVSQGRNVTGEFPTNFKKLFDELAVLKEKIKKKWKQLKTIGIICFIFLLLAITPLLPVSMIVEIIGLVAAGITGLGLASLNSEYNNYISANKYNLCYYLLKLQSDFAEKSGINKIAGVSGVLECINNEEGKKVSLSVTKKLMEKYMEITYKDHPKKELTSGKSDKEELISCKKCGQSIKSTFKFCPYCSNTTVIS